MKFVTACLDFFLPRRCASCNSSLTLQEFYVCSQCLGKIKYADKDRLEFEFRKKFERDKIISGFVSLFIFEKDKELQRIIHELKYEGMFRLGVYLGEMFANNLQDQVASWSIDIITPIPLHHLKRAERGYNQSDFIARGIGSKLNIPVGKRLIKRVRFTSTQTELTLQERKQNVLNAFAIRGKPKLQGRNILLIDDVITTGATVSECGRILLRAGASKVYAASMAIAD